METQDTSIAEYIKASSRGDNQAFHKLYEHINPALFAFLASRTKTRDDAKDLLQDLLMDVWQAMPRFRYSTDKQFWSFLYTIARRKLYHYYNDLKPTINITENISSSDNQTDIVDNKQLLNLLINKLPIKLRLVIELRHFVDLPFAGIAKQLGEKESTIKVRHHRALKKLSQLANTYE